MVENKNLQQGEVPKNAVPATPEVASSETADDVFRLLEGAASSDEEVRVVKVAGEKVNAKEAFQKFKEALQLTREKLTQMGIKIDLNDIQFQKLEGNMVGESVERATLLDPALFRHPVFVIAMVLSHELLHKNNSIPNEGMVQAIAEQLYGGSGNVEHEYKEMVKNFKELAALCDESGDAEVGAREIYELYDVKKYEDIYELFMNKLKTEQEKDEAHEFFARIFPELRYQTDGDTKVREVDLDQRA